MHENTATEIDDGRPEEGGVPKDNVSGKPDVPGYTVHEQIGEGAMGAVWRATQLSTQRDVALKFLPESWLASPAMRRRFEREIEIAARLEHPNIARVYDSGLRHGSYYYAMQYVQGRPLDRYITETQPTVLQRLRLFETICEVVQHAHINGIIHRDLKPSNILVTTDGSPFILDFGLAKPTEETSDMTVEGAIAGTPQYMSPEQARGETGRLDTRTDVYSLGVMLYEILTGHLPHPPGGGLVRLLRAIAETDATRPTRHVPRMHRDVEAILLKALARDKERRYITAAGLAADLRRYLNRRPVNAQPMTPGYVLRLWLARHRIAVGVALLVALTLGAGAGLSVARIRRERDVAQENFRLARGAVQEFLARLGDRGLGAQPGTTRMRRMLLRNARDFYEELLQRAPDDIDLQVDLSRVLTVLAEQDVALEDTAESRWNIGRAILLQQAILEKRPDDDWTAMMLAMGHDQLGRIAMEEGALDEAARHLSTALEIKERLRALHPENGQYRVSTAYGYRLAARLARANGEISEAMEWEQRAFEINLRQQQDHPDDTLTLQMLARQWSDYAKMLRDSHGSVFAAVELQQRANAINERLAAEGPDNPAAQRALAYSSSELAKSFAAMGNMEMAIETELAACNLKRQLVEQTPHDPGARRALLFSLHQLTQFYLRMGHLGEAERTLQEAAGQIEIFARLSRDPTRAARTIAFFHNLRGALAHRHARFDEALEAYETAVNTLTAQFGDMPDNADVRTMLVCQGVFRLDTLAEAERLSGFSEIADTTGALLAAWPEPTAIVRYYAARLMGLRARALALAGDVTAAEQAMAAAREEIFALLSERIALPDDPNQGQALLAMGITLEDIPAGGVAAGLLTDVETEFTGVLDGAPGGAMDGVARDPSRSLSAEDHESLLEAVGQEVDVVGVVTSCAWNRTRSHLFINFGERGASFYALIYASDYDAFLPLLGTEPERSLPGRRLRVHGTLAQHRGWPQMVLSWPQQLEFLPDTQIQPPQWLAEGAGADIDWRFAAEYIGEVRRVSGRVVRTEMRENLCFLDFTDAPGSGGTFHLPMLPHLFDAWPESPDVYFLGRHIRVTGRVLRFRGTPQITIDHAAQIEFIDP